MVDHEGPTLTIMRSVAIALIATKYDGVSLIEFRHMGSHVSTAARSTVSQIFGTRNHDRADHLLLQCFRVPKFWDTELNPLEHMFSLGFRVPKFWDTDLRTVETLVCTTFPCPKILGRGIEVSGNTSFH